jgi:RHS repeat-associated protein
LSYLNIWGLAMRSGIRWATAIVIWCVALGGTSQTALGGGTQIGGGASGPGGLRIGALVVPGMDALSGGQEAQAEALARRDSPEAVFARERSRTEFHGLDSTRAGQLAQEAFPSIIDQPAGGLPSLAAGQRIVNYPADNAVQVELPDGKHGVIVTDEPIATETSPGHRKPIDLRLTSSHAGFQPMNPAIGLRLPRYIESGVQLPDTGVSLTAVNAQGAPLGGSEGTIDGTSVLYANTLTDTDTVAKPTTFGFELDALLRSVDSPEQLYYRVEMPTGAVLAPSKEDLGAVDIIQGGATIAVVLAPNAEDAAGTSVPVSMSFAGDMLTLTIDHRTGQYQYPINVDPSVIDKTLAKGHWEYLSHNFTGSESSGSLIDSSTVAQSGLKGLWGYETLGESHIYALDAETSSTGEHVENEWMMVRPPGVIEKDAFLPASYGTTKTELCSEAGCAAGKVTTGEGGNAKNVVDFEQIGIGEGGRSFTSTLSYAAVSILQEKAPTASFDFSGAKIGIGSSEYTNVLYAGGWLGPNTGAFEAEQSDPGIGLNKYSWKSSTTPSWNREFASTCVECSGTAKILKFTYWTVYENGSTAYGIEHPLADGEDTVEVKGSDATGLSGATTPVKVKVDGTPPYGITLTGLPPNREIGSGLYHLKATAKDGSGTTVSSGVESLVLKVDGKQVGSPSGSCPVGPCTATGEWTVSGSEFAVGQHEITITATDKAANVAVEKFSPIFVGRPTSPIGMGPGETDPQSGEMGLTTTDASVAVADGSLSVGRSYGSLHLTEGAQGPLGPQWSLSIGSTQSLTKLPDGDMLLSNGLGLQAVYTSKGGGEFTPPKGDEGLVLSERKSGEKVEYLLKSGSGAVTTFTLSSSGEGNIWVPTIREQAGGLNPVTIAYKLVGGFNEPREILAAKPTGVSSCSPTVEAPLLEKGCRALELIYGTKTTAAGDGQAEWGEYEGRLKEITFTAWSTAAAKMTTVAVAHYEYDKEGKLRAEWDPRISPLKTTYGYDSAGHITAVTQPGQQPWLITYGTIAGDLRNGRTLAVKRPEAKAGVGTGIAPKDTAVPSISGTVAVGSTLTLSNGTWSNSPLTYAYQWENCNISGAECSPIAGATNSSYIVYPSNVGHKLVGRVWATDSDGSGEAVSTATTSVASPKAFFYNFGSLGSGNGEFKGPAGVAVDGSGDVWVVDSGDNRLEKFTASGVFVAAYGSSGTGIDQFSKPTGIAYNASTGDIFVSDTGNNRIEKFSSSNGKFIETFGWGVKDGKAEAETCTTECRAGTSGSESGEFKEPAGITTSSAGIWVADSGNNRVQVFLLSNDKYSSKFGTAGSGSGQFSKPQGVALYKVAGFEYEFVTDTGNNRVEEFQGPTYQTQVGTAGTGNGQFSSPVGIYLNARETAIFVVDKGNNRVERFRVFAEEKPTYESQYGTHGTGYFGQFSGPEWIVESTSGQQYVSDSENNRAVEVSEYLLPDPPVTPPSPPSPGTSSVTTLEYHVPISGLTAPYAMGSSEVESWGQKADKPVEATAIFPPDKPEGWPAEKYERATVLYLDNKGHTVNVASPTGGISTTEYNGSNDVERTLSADSRAKAIAEGSKSVEVSKLLDTKNKYNGKGDEIESSEGPQHNVMLANGTQVQARHITKYFYSEEEAPVEGRPYDLLTKTTDGAEVAGKEEEVRTVTTSYSGQEGLGWKLRKPTSVTSDPSGLKLTHTFKYEGSTGNPIEVTSPTGAAENPPPAYALTFGSSGNKEGQFTHPMDDAIDASGNVWVADGYDSRVEEFSSAGAFIASYGKEGTNSAEGAEVQFKEPVGIGINRTTGNIYVGDQNNNRVVEFSPTTGKIVRVFGKTGTGHGEFKEADGVTVDSKGNVWVTDYANNRVQKFGEEGKYLSEFGTAGKEKGQFSGPNAIAISGENLYVTDLEDARVEEFNEEGKKFVREFGSAGTGNGQFKAPTGIATSASGNVLVSDSGNGRVEEFSSTGVYLFSFGTSGSGNGQMATPEGIAVSSTGAAYVTDAGSNNRVQEWVPNSGGAHSNQLFYYSAKAESAVAICQNHPEWTGLPCLTRPAKQPETSGLPGLPESTDTYNIWDEPETTTETVGSTTRTETTKYDPAGRPETNSVSSTVGVGLPTVTNKYSSETGFVTEQSATIEGKLKTIADVYNKLGELESYTDADASKATYEYDEDGRPKKIYDGKGTQSYTYDKTTGLLHELVDSSAEAMKFTATYDVEGNMLTESYPNAMTASYTYDSTGSPTTLEYIKTSHCKTTCGEVWFSDAVVPSIHGQWLSQSSTLSKQAYTYDAAGRLTQVENTPTGKGCTTRVYSYDEDTNRTGLATHEANEKGECTSTGGTTENHTYDTADRLTDSGVTYNTFGDTTSVPAGDAGGTELTSTYYADNQLQSETQHEQTIGYNLDPDRRTRETVSTGKVVSDVTAHYAAPGSTPAWTVNTASETTREIPGINGVLVAVQNNLESPTLQLTNLHGDVVATASMNETVTELAKKVDTSEFGVPTTSVPLPYSWLGADEIPTELSSGVLDMGVRSYVPQLGRFLQPDPFSGGSASAYTYTFGDPVNSSDPSGAFAQWFVEFSQKNGEEVAAAAAAREAAAEREAAERASEAAEQALELAGDQEFGGEEGEEEWEEYEEEEEWEYASYRHGSGAHGEGSQTEPGLLIQPLGEGERGLGLGRDVGGAVVGETVPLCEVGGKGPCSRDVKGGPGGGCKKGCRRRIKSLKKGGGPDVGKAIKAVNNWIRVEGEKLAKGINDSGTTPDEKGLEGDESGGDEDDEGEPPSSTPPTGAHKL